MTDNAYAERKALLIKLAAKLAEQSREHVEWRDLRYDEELRSWVWPLMGLTEMDPDRGRWVRRCRRLFIYDTRRRCWYGSEIQETLDAHLWEGRYLNEVLTEVWGDNPELRPQDDHSNALRNASADGDALDTTRESWAELLW